LAVDSSTGEVKIKAEFKTQPNVGFALQVLLLFLLPGLMLWKKSLEAHQLMGPWSIVRYLRVCWVKWVGKKVMEWKALWSSH